MSGADLTFSIIINTNGRAQSLRRTIESLRLLDYPHFELCVVAGPAEDEARAYLRALEAEKQIKLAFCDDLNLSASRNIGIALSAGEFVAFIDDDALPEADWLTDLSSAYAHPEIAGAGGLTYDHTGCVFQAQYILCDRFGNAEILPKDPDCRQFCHPYALRFPSLLGTNSSFRRSDLAAIGGFDEEYEYFLDETDVCCRLIDAGKHIVQLSKAFVHHKYLPSHLRNEARELTVSYPIFKNKLYFSFINNHNLHTEMEIDEDAQKFIALHRSNFKWRLKCGKLTKEDLCAFDAQTERAWNDGRQRGLSQQRRIRSYAYFENPPLFREFPRRRAAQPRRNFVFLSQNYPPAAFGGNARHTRDIARALSQLGHDVHVFTKGSQFNRVDLEEGVWVHRLIPVRLGGQNDAANEPIKKNKKTVSARLPKSLRIAARRLRKTLTNVIYPLTLKPPILGPAAKKLRKVLKARSRAKEQKPKILYALQKEVLAPMPIWSYSAALLKEAHRINAARPIDIVEAVSWDCEGAAFIFDGAFLCLINIVTSLAHFLETHPQLRANKHWMTSFGEPMLLLESHLFEQAFGFVSASRAITQAIETAYDVSFEPGRVEYCPHGIADMRDLSRRPPKGLPTQNGRLSILFVGRLELRKGIDTLLTAAALVLALRDDVEFWIVGNESAVLGDPVATGPIRSLMAEAEQFKDRVRFLGAVNDEELRWLYANCDIFAAPSRFESFGIIFVEAMMFSKPVVGCRSGGVGEVVRESQTGLLAPPGDSQALAQALLSLIGDSAMREAFGVAGRRLYEECYEAHIVAQQRAFLFEDFIKKWRASRLTFIGSDI